MLTKTNSYKTADITSKQTKSNNKTKAKSLSQPLEVRKENITSTSIASEEDSYVQVERNKIPSKPLLRRLKITSALSSQIVDYKKAKNIQVKEIHYKGFSTALCVSKPYDHFAKIKASFSSKTERCDKIIWEDHLIWKNYKLLRQLFKTSKSTHIELILHIPKFRVISMYRYTQLLQNLPKTTKYLKVSISPSHPVIPECLKILFSEVRKLPNLETLYVGYGYNTGCEEFNFDLLEKSLRTRKQVQVNLTPIRFSSPEDVEETRLNPLLKLNSLSSLGVNMDPKNPMVKTKIVNFINQLVNLKRMTLKGSFTGDLEPILDNIAYLKSLETLSLNMSSTAEALEALLDIKGKLKNLKLEYHLVPRWNLRDFERDFEVLSFMSQLETLELSFTGCRIPDAKHIGLFLSHIERLKALRIKIQQTFWRDCMLSIFKPMNLEIQYLEELEISVSYSDHKISQEFEALSNMLKKQKRLQRFSLAILEDIKGSEDAVGPGDLTKLLNGLSGSKAKLKKVKIDLNRCEGFADRKSGTILSNFCRTLSYIEELDVNLGKRYFMDVEIKNMFKWIGECLTLKWVKIGGDFSYITPRVFSLMIEQVWEISKKKDIQVLPMNYSRENYHTLLKVMDLCNLKKMF